MAHRLVKTLDVEWDIVYGHRGDDPVQGEKDAQISTIGHVVTLLREKMESQCCSRKFHGAVSLLDG